jgi:hypothetical protein
MKQFFPLVLAALLVLIIAAHAAMLADPDIPRDTAWRLARINALAWAVILLPPIFVGLWLRAHQRRNRDR